LRRPRREVKGEGGTKRWRKEYEKLQKENKIISLKGKGHPGTEHEGPEGSRGIALFFL
jgi:hypothetical protein